MQLMRVLRRLRAEAGRCRRGLARAIWREPPAATLLRSLLYSSDAYVDVLKIDEYAYYMNTLDYAYEHWRGSPAAQFEFRPGDDFQPLLPFTDRDVQSHQRHTTHCLTYAMCHFWSHNVDFTYVDIGANYGTTVIPVGAMIHRLGRKNKCLAFEPGLAGNLLGFSVELNGLGDVIAVDRRAADEKNGTTLFHNMLGNSAANTALDIHTKAHMPLARSSVVRTVRLDDVVDGPVVAKIDTEGNDFRVLRGMERIVRDHDACLIFEFNPSYVQRTSDPLEELRRASSAFELYAIEPEQPWNSFARAEPTSDFICRVSKSQRGWADIFAIKRGMPSFSELKRGFESRFLKSAA